MSARILQFDPNRKVPTRHYTPIALRGRLLYMPHRSAEAAGSCETRFKTTMTFESIHESGRDSDERRGRFGSGY